MGLSVIAYNNLQVAPYKLEELVELKVEKKINQHTKLYFTGVVAEGMKDKYIDMTKAETQVEVNLTGDESKPLFKGIVLKVEIKSVRDIYYIEAEAVSHTYTLDVKLKNRSFQDKAMTYNDLVKKVISEYPGADFIDEASKGKTIEKYTMQYQETDWEFIKRMASRFNAGLVPDHTADKPKFYFGVHEGNSETFDEFHYSVRKKISDFKNSSQNYIKDIDENDFVYYDVESGKLLDIGCKVDFKGKSLYVNEVTTQMQQSVLRHQYLLSTKKGLSQNNIYNDKIIGLSLQGEVIAVEKDDIKVHLEIDKSQSVGEAWWFPYSTVYTAEGNSGWYCMPELKDIVSVYFPNNKEENGISVNSLRQDINTTKTNKVDKPEVKYFRTKNGKELKFSPEEIVITAKDDEIYIRLNEKDGIEIYSKKEVKVVTNDDLIIDAQKSIAITAKQSIDITCKQSNINMNGITSIKGNQVKTN